MILRAITVLSVNVCAVSRDIYRVQNRVNGYYVEGGWKDKLAQRKDGITRKHTRGFTGRQG